MSEFTDLIQFYLSRAKMKKVDLAKKLCVTQTFVGRLLDGQNKPTGYERMSQIADILGLSKIEKTEFLTAAWKAKFTDDDKQFFNAYSDLLQTAGLEAYGPLFKDQDVAALVVTQTMGELLSELRELPEGLRTVALKTAITTAKGLKGV